MATPTDSTNLIRIIQERFSLTRSIIFMEGHEPCSGQLRGHSEYTANADGIGTLRILEAVRLLGPHLEDTDLPRLLPPNYMDWCKLCPKPKTTPF